MSEIRRMQEQLRQMLEADAAVVAIAVLGSVARAQADSWSDLDLLIVVEDDAFARFFPTLDWLDPCGARFAHEQFAAPFASVTRVCFADLRRLDCVITTVGAVTRLPSWDQAPYWAGARLLFARSDAVARHLAAPSSPASPPAFTAAGVHRRRLRRVAARFLVQGDRGHHEGRARRPAHRAPPGPRHAARLRRAGNAPARPRHRHHHPPGEPPQHRVRRRARADSSPPRRWRHPDHARSGGDRVRCPRRSLVGGLPGAARPVGARDRARLDATNVACHSIAVSRVVADRGVSA